MAVINGVGSAVQSSDEAHATIKINSQPSIVVLVLAQYLESCYAQKTH